MLTKVCLSKKKYVVPHCPIEVKDAILKMNRQGPIIENDMIWNIKSN